MTISIYPLFATVEPVIIQIYAIIAETHNPAGCCYLLNTKVIGRCTKAWRWFAECIGVKAQFGRQEVFKCRK